jgi:presqualene diphosphate synthase
MMAETAANGVAARASGSSFYAAMRILPRARRQAIFEVYGFCRAVDDVADASGPREPRLAALAQWRAEVNSLYAGAPPARLRGLVEPVRRYELSREGFLAVIAGMEMDVTADIRAPDFSTLDLYCDRVASAVGRLCVNVFGMEAEAGKTLAHHLGRALQLTNILRDLVEDAARGRLYLPREALEAAGILIDDPALVLMHPALGAACAPVIERAKNHFRAADAIMDRAPRGAIRAPRIMAEAYKRILTRLIERGFSAPRVPVRLNKPQLAWILIRHALF